VGTESCIEGVDFILDNDRPGVENSLCLLSFAQSSIVYNIFAFKSSDSNIKLGSAGLLDIHLSFKNSGASLERIQSNVKCGVLSITLSASLLKSCDLVLDVGDISVSRRVVVVDVRDTSFRRCSASLEGGDATVQATCSSLVGAVG